MSFSVGRERDNVTAAVSLTSRRHRVVSIVGISFGPPIWWVPKFHRDDEPSPDGYPTRRLTVGFLVVALRWWRGTL